MPQMKPMNWLILFFLFSLIIFTMNIFNFYSLNNLSNKNNLLNKNNSQLLNWKW